MCILLSQLDLTTQGNYELVCVLERPSLSLNIMDMIFYTSYQTPQQWALVLSNPSVLKIKRVFTSVYGLSTLQINDY